jgi:hypothetical protein
MGMMGGAVEAGEGEKRSWLRRYLLSSLSCLEFSPTIWMRAAWATKMGALRMSRREADVGGPLCLCL